MPFSLRLYSLAQKFKNHGMYVTLKELTDDVDPYLILELEHIMNLVDKWEDMKNPKKNYD